ncbi:MAG: hypothetical protein JOZ69_14205 [Myxococcales bacterium]|nr:hypothetical protein [Myxococcales bacterium]
MAVDDKYLYWLDLLQIGAVRRVLTAGGTPTIVAYDALPLAIAVDANAVYWSDQAGTITRFAK